MGIGDYISNFIRYSLRLTPYQGGTWVQDWTIFYWAWAIAWSPFVGAFIARVSRGRTIREFIVGVLVVPPLIALMWIAVFGGTALHLDLFNGTSIAEGVNKDVTSALFSTYGELPFTMVLSVLSILLIFTFLITSADSATYILSSMTTEGSLNPPMIVKIVWGVLIAAIAAVLLVSSGLEGLTDRFSRLCTAIHGNPDLDVCDVIPASPERKKGKPVQQKNNPKRLYSCKRGRRFLSFSVNFHTK